jgi:SET domain-containing protein
MKIKLATKVEVKTSPGKGMGVFATNKIAAGEIIEECHLIFLEMDLNQQSSFLEHYRFLYPQKPKQTLRGALGLTSPPGQQTPVPPRYEDFVIPSGYGCIYNHDNNNNAYWRDRPNHKTFQFIAKRDISVGEEICTYYGNVQFS